MNLRYSNYLYNCVPHSGSVSCKCLSLKPIVSKPRPVTSLMSHSSKKPRPALTGSEKPCCKIHKARLLWFLGRWEFSNDITWVYDNMQIGERFGWTHSWSLFQCDQNRHKGESRVLCWKMMNKQAVLTNAFLLVAFRSVKCCHHRDPYCPFIIHHSEFC